LTRAFRYYGKKRGHRRTGSPVWGVAVEAAFSTVFFFAGCGVLAYMFFHQFAPHWRVNQKFVETACKVLDTHIEEIEGQGGPAFQPKLKIEYAAKGEIETTADYDIGNTKFNNREDAQDILDRFEIFSPERNNLYPCWYDPADPYTVVMTRDYPRWMWLAFTVPISFIILGAGGLIHTVFGWGKSVERRSARKRNGMERDARVAGGEGDRRFPGIPAGADLTNSPGTKLKYRLPESGSTGWRLFGLFAACVFWNGIVALFVWDSARGHLAGNPDWFGTLFLIPFVLIGLAIIVYFLRQLLVVAGIGPTRIEISAHPLRPGGRYAAFLSQSGRLDLNSLRVSLICAETARYRQGTNTRTETQEVFRREFFHREGFAVQRGMPFETEIEFEVPERAMHSFKAKNNEIAWALAVEGDVAGWPDFRRAFAVIVHPRSGDGSQ